MSMIRLFVLFMIELSFTKMNHTIFGARPHNKLPSSNTRIAKIKVILRPKMSENFPYIG